MSTYLVAVVVGEYDYVEEILPDGIIVSLIFCLIASFKSYGDPNLFYFAPLNQKTYNIQFSIPVNI